MFQSQSKIKRLLRKVDYYDRRVRSAELELRQRIQCVNRAAIVSETDASGNITYANEKFCEMSGYRLEELVGQNHRLLKSGVQSQEIYEDLWKTISSGKTWKGELVNRAKDGSLYWVDTTIMPFIDEKGVIYKYVSVRFDITAQKESQQKLREQEHLKYHSLILSSRLNPHFIFNSLNAIQHFILKSEVEESLLYLSRFAALMRMVLDNSEEHFIPLQREIEFLEQYLSLEQVRFENGFEYKLNVEEGLDIDEVTIPPMLIQPYLENVLVHAFAGIKYKGKISVNITSVKDKLILEIEDNGIGREQAILNKARRLDQSYESKGLKLVKNRLDILGQLHQCKSAVSTLDLYDEKGEPVGTKVVIRMEMID